MSKKCRVEFNEEHKRYGIQIEGSTTVYITQNLWFEPENMCGILKSLIEKASN